MANATTKHSKKIQPDAKVPHTFEKLRDKLAKLPKEQKLK